MSLDGSVSGRDASATAQVEAKSVVTEVQPAHVRIAADSSPVGKSISGAYFVNMMEDAEEDVEASSILDGSPHRGSSAEYASTVDAGSHPVRLLRGAWRIPSTVRLDFDFYKVFFLNMINEKYNVSTIQVILCFERLARLIGLKLAKDSARTLAHLQDENKIVHWDKYLSLVKGYESKAMYLGSNRVNPGEKGELVIDQETTLVLTPIERINITIEDSGSSNWASLIALYRVGIIVLSVTSIVLESVPGLKVKPNCDQDPCLGEPEPRPLFGTIEMVTTICFTVDFAIRLALAGFVRSELTDRARIIEMGVGRGKFVIHKTFETRLFAFLFSLSTVIDLVAIMPYYIRIGLSSSKSHGLQVVRIVRLGTILRLMRIRQFRDMQMILPRAFSQSLSALAILILGFMILILFFSVLVYFQESGDWYPAGSVVNGVTTTVGHFYRPTAINEDVLELTPFTSIPAAVWWAIITALTIGYGDMVPASTGGKYIGGLLAIAGVIVLAMPIAVIGSNFTTEYTRFYGIRKQLVQSKDQDIQRKILVRYLQDTGLTNEHITESESGETVVSSAARNALTKKLTELAETYSFVTEIAQEFGKLSENAAEPDPADVAEFVKESLELIEANGNIRILHILVFEIAIELIQPAK